MTAPLRVLSSMATRALLDELADLWRAQDGEPLILESVGGVDAARRVMAGEPFDVVVLASEAIDRLVDGNRAIGESKADLVRSDVAIAVRQGTPHPAVHDEAALKATLLSAQHIAFSTGPSGSALQRLFDRWGIAETLRSRLLLAPPGVPVGTLVAEGLADLGFQQLSELRHLAGIDVLGPMPPGLEIVTTFSAARCSVSVERGSVERLLKFLRSPATDDAKRRHGMRPAWTDQTEPT